MLGCCFSRALRGSLLVVECDIMEQIAGLNGSVDHLPALGAMEKGKPFCTRCCVVGVWKPKNTRIWKILKVKMPFSPKYLYISSSFKLLINPHNCNLPFVYLSAFKIHIYLLFVHSLATVSSNPAPSLLSARLYQRCCGFNPFAHRGWLTWMRVNCWHGAVSYALWSKTMQPSCFTTCLQICSQSLPQRLPARLCFTLYVNPCSLAEDWFIWW